MTNRRFPPPWSIECLPGGFKVVDANGQFSPLSHARENHNDANTAGVLTMDEARRLASNFAKLPELHGSDLGFGSAPHFLGCIGLDLDVLRSSLGGKTARGSVGTSTQKTRWAVT